MTKGVGARALAFGFAAMGYAVAGDMAIAGSQCGKAAWYDLEGLTASGEQSNGAVLAAAHRSLPFGTRVKVENLRNGRTVVVRVNDRGPFVAGRVIDVTKAAAEKLGFISAGIARVRVTALDGKGVGIVGSCSETPAVVAKPAAKKAVAEKTRDALRAPAPAPARKAVAVAVAEEAPAEAAPVSDPPATADHAETALPKEADIVMAARKAATVARVPNSASLLKEADIVASARKAAVAAIPPSTISPPATVVVKPKRAGVVSVPYEEAPIDEDVPDGASVGDVDAADSSEGGSAADDVAVVEAAVNEALGDIPLPRLRPGAASVATVSTAPADARFGGAFQPDLTRFVHAFQPDDYNAIGTVKDLPFTLLGLE